MYCVVVSDYIWVSRTFGDENAFSNIRLMVRFLYVLLLVRDQDGLRPVIFQPNAARQTPPIS